uniref:Integrase_H2C2 domain-containing protein n=1 Tax=Loa loa TaxID=7209 RepID=A0A1I7VAL5_LOALO
MTSSIIASIKPAENRLVFPLKEINSLVFESPGPNSSYEQKGNLYTARIQVLADKIDRVQLYIKSLKEVYEMWLSHIQTITTKKRNEEEKVFESVLEGEQGLFRVMHEGQEAIITLTRHKNETEQKLEGILKIVRKEHEIIIPSPNHIVQLLQLSLPTFNGDPRQWRQFWSSFDAAVHSQTIPDIQKLNYLYSCLRGEALQAVSGYEIAPENYGIIRQLLKNKYGDPPTIASILYRELQSFKQNEKERMATIENIERVLRQLELLGDNLEHPSIHSKENRQAVDDSEIKKLHIGFGGRESTVKIDQCSNFRADSKPATIKRGQKRMYRTERTSALSTIQTNHRETRSPTIRKRPCIFCSRDHWDSDCDIYSTVKGRMERLKTLKKCIICLKDSHQGETCKAKKRCFYCKASHDSVLCEKRSTPTLDITTLPKKQESIYPDKKEGPVLLYHSTGEPQTNKAKNILLLCKEIGVFNPEHPQKQRRALALFDIGSQLSFISKKLSSQLQLAESDHRNMLVAPFGTKEPLQCPTANAYISKGRFVWLKEVPEKPKLTSYELAEATKALIRQAQSEGINEKEVNKWNLYYSNTHSLWKCRSRLDNTSMGIYSGSLNLICLPITKLFIQHQHEDLHHAGIAHTLSELRRNFWIPKGRTEVKSVLNKCMACKRWRAKPFKLPVMPNVPETRIKRTRTFEHVGLDYLGPLSIKGESVSLKDG